MVSKHSSTNRVRRTAAFTLVEYVVALSIGLMVLTAATVLWAYASRTCAQLYNYVELSVASKNALDRISQNLRNAVSVTGWSTNWIIVRVPRNDNTTNLDQVTIAWSPTTQKVTSLRGTETKTLLTECPYFEFKVFTRVPTAGTNTLNAAADILTAKVVQMQWTTSRKLTGDQKTTESLVSSRVVMRSK